jgi:hypothetical protein
VKLDYPIGEPIGKYEPCGREPPEQVNKRLPNFSLKTEYRQPCGEWLVTSTPYQAVPSVLLNG